MGGGWVVRGGPARPEKRMDSMSVNTKCGNPNLATAAQKLN